MKKRLRLLSAGLAVLASLSALTACRTELTPPPPTEEDSSIQAPPSDGTAAPTDPPIELPEQPPMESIEYYQNPLLTAETHEAWPGYGFGDPFVMRHNGMYYLYVSTKDGSIGVKCWSSPDLVNWTYEGYCTNEKITKGAYAPEVFYYNGYFYMYTSPGGNGHYVLRSTSPTKGFKVITDNMGMSIDGSVFINNNGRWYFYTAGAGAMRAYEMTSPSSMQKGSVLDEITVNGGWTEGPMTVYHDGYYYMTYTGNHVLSPSYRIYYGVSSRSPLSFSAGKPSNPLLINTSEEIFGIGHSSTVKGPDLDSYYLVYHSLVNKTPNRNTSIDRIVFNRESMKVMGPTVSPQQAPDLPDVYHRFEAGSSLKGWTLNGGFGKGGTGLTLSAGSSLLSHHAFEGDFTAEYNLTAIAEGARAGVLFGYTDQDNFGVCYLDPAAQKAVIEITVKGKTTVTEADMIRSFGEDVRFDCLQALQIERCGRDYTFYMNDRLLCAVSDSDLAGGSIGYITEGGQASFGFIGGTGAVGGRASADDYKSVSELNGLIPASEHLEKGPETVVVDDLNAVAIGAGETLTYRILAEADGEYDLAALYATAGTGGASLTVCVDGTPIRTLPLLESASLSTAVSRAIPLTKGQHTVSFALTEGEGRFVEFTLLKAETVSSLIMNGEDMDQVYAYSDGPWALSGSALTVSGNAPTGKRLFGDKNWGDYTVTAEITLRNGNNCGLLVRATDPGSPAFLDVPPTASEAKTGTDWVQGYYIGLSGDAVFIGKQSYGYAEVARAEGSFRYGAKYTLEVECKGATLRVFINGVLYLEYTDPTPYLQGMVGLRAFSCSAQFHRLKVSAE